MDEFPLKFFLNNSFVRILFICLSKEVRPLQHGVALFNLPACNGRLTVHTVIRQMAGAIGHESYFRFFQNMSVMPATACTNNKTSTATYNGL